MKKIIATITLLLMMYNVAYSAGMQILTDGISVTFNDDTGYPFIKDGRTLVPLRVTMESFGAEVGWESESRTAVVKRENTIVRCTIGEKCIYKNNKMIENDAVATIVDGRTYLPIRAVLEAFGAAVNWEDGLIRVESNYKEPLIVEIESGQTTETSYMVAYNEALSLMESGKYERAIEKILSFSSIFVNKGDLAGNAMLFEHIGECYLNMEEYQNAAVCFKREAYYWSKTENSEENRLAAQEKFKFCKEKS